MSVGGWLHKCGHFHPSTFLQVAQVNHECHDCQAARELLKEAIALRKGRVSREPKYKFKANTQSAQRRRRADCKMPY